MIRDFGFAPPLYQRRLNIAFRNPDPPDQFGTLIAAFWPGDTLLVLSAPADLPSARAKSRLEQACHEFAEIAKRTRRNEGREKAVSFRAYLGPMNQLVITRRTSRATLAKYRGDAKFSHAFKPKGIKTDERVLHSVDVT